jgi:hypothetical protein
MIDYSKLAVFTDKAELHVSTFLETFSKHIKEHGKDSFAPMVSYIGFEDDPLFVITSRSVESKDDMFKSFSEMLYAFSALDSKFFIFANDARQWVYENKESMSKDVQPSESMVLSFVSKEQSAILSVPYEYDAENGVKWQLDSHVISSLVKENPTEIYQGDSVELFYVMSQIRACPFTFRQLLNYYNYKGFTYKLNKNVNLEKVQLSI